MKLNAIVFLLLISCGAPAIARQDGATLYAAHCAQCHDSGDPQSRVPGVAAFPRSIDGPRWNGRGADLNNSRFQPAGMAGLTAEQVPRLTLKRAYAFPGATLAFAQPTVVLLAFEVGK